MAKPNVVVVKLPGLAGGRGANGNDGVSAVNNIVNPVLSNDISFNNKVEIADLSYQMSPSVSLTYEATIILRGLDQSSAILYVEGPDNSLVSGVITYPYSAAPEANSNQVAFGIPRSNDSDYFIVKINGSVRNSNNTGKIGIYIENAEGLDGGFVAKGSLVQWSVPVYSIISPPSTGGGSSNGISKDQADLLYASKNDTRLTDSRMPLDRSVNANKIAPGGLPISSIDALRGELDSRVKTINGTSPDTTGNVNINGNGVSGITETQADTKYTKLNDPRLTDQRVPIDNSVINIKVPNNGLDVSKINGLTSSIDSLVAQISNLTYRIQQIEQNGAQPGGGTPGSGYPSVYTATY